MAKKTAIRRAAKALATADGVAHVAFFWIFVWRAIASGPIGKTFAIAWTLLAVVGLVADVLGWMLVKHGGRTPAGKVGLWLIALSTAIAALLLFAAA